jgi:hypothetical protein
MKMIMNLAAFVAAMTTVPALADQSETMERPSMSLSQSTMVSAMVQAIDHETRVVTLDMGDGELLTFTASPEARNLGQVEVGDIVHAEYVERFTARVMANDGLAPGEGEIATMARTEEGAMPGAMLADTRVVTATVEEINIEANTFKLKGPDGVVEEYYARNPENLKHALVGDMVVMTFTEGVAISVEEGTRGQ